MSAIQSEIDVSEIYSPPRVAKMARKMVMMPGWPFDIATVDEKAVPWDFTKPERRNEAARRLLRDKPVLPGGKQYVHGLKQFDEPQLG